MSDAIETGPTDAGVAYEGEPQKTREQLQAEMRAELETMDVAKLPQVPGVLLIGWTCPCGDHRSAPDMAMLALLGSGRAAVVKCPKCNQYLTVTPPRPPERPRIVQPGVNRSMRRMAAAIARKG